MTLAIQAAIAVGAVGGEREDRAPLLARTEE